MIFPFPESQSVFKNSYNVMFPAFDAILFVLDHNGGILEYKDVNGVPPTFSLPREMRPAFQDFVPVDVQQKYEQATRQLRSGSRLALFDYVLPHLNGWIWCESFLIPFSEDRDILFMRNVTNIRGMFDQEKIIENWLRVLFLRDRETEDHTRRVTELALQLARRLGITSSDLMYIRFGAMLHDIGKVAIPDNILFKPGPLTEEEWGIMRRHPVIATELLDPFAYLAPALAIPRSHHEQWDGNGYPDGLAGADIPLAARIFAFADVYDALTPDRPYRPAWSQAEALDFIQKKSGVHFDPSITPVFIGMF
jgi:putative nucleotidyltransferase with HDIG domain